MKFTFTTYIVRKNILFYWLSSSLNPYQYEATCTIGDKTLKCRGQGEEIAIERLKDLIEHKLRELGQVEVEYPFERPVRETTESGGRMFLWP
jgi:hypothetical protein